MSAVLDQVGSGLKRGVAALGIGRRNRFKAPPRRGAPAKPARLVPLLGALRAHAAKAGLALAAVVALAALTLVLDRPVASIAMDGRFERVSPGEIERAVRPFMHAGLLSADLDAIQRAVEALPWVEHARIQRLWPSSLKVVVTEQTAAARWGEAGLINTRGELFVRAASHVPAELPRLSGPEGSEAEVAQRYLALQGRMAEAGMRIAALRLDERGAWQLDLDSGLTVRLGRRDVDERTERFLRAAAPVIAHRLGEIAYVDMRYSNGFAIGWRTPATPAATPAAPLDDT
jgi:cell division protein FtsQ